MLIQSRMMTLVVVAGGKEIDRWMIDSRCMLKEAKKTGGGS